MEVKRLHNIGDKGLATDPAPWSLPAEFITSGINFRIFSGSIISKSGYQFWSQAPVQFYPAFPFNVGSTSGDYWLIAGRDAIYSFDGFTWSDVSSAIGYPSMSVDDELRWSGCMMGAIPILNNPQAQPEYWSPQSPSQIMQGLIFEPGVTWQEKGYTANIFRSHRNFLFALDTTEGGIEYKDSFRWSHPADINGLPFTWDEDDPTALAGKAALGGEGGTIIDGYTMRDAFCIYSEGSINILDYTGDQFVWKRRKLSATVGLLSKNCIVEVKGVHYFLADGDIVSNDGNRVDSIAHNRIRRDLSSRIDIDNYDRSYAVRNDSMKEIWFCVPDAGATYPNIAYIYNYRDDSWAIKDILETVAYSGYGSQSRAEDSWDSQPDAQVWDSQTRAWGSSKLTPLDDTIIGAAPETFSLYLLDPEGTPDTDYPSRIERTDYPLVDDRSVTTITRIYPHMEGEGDVSIQFGSQDHPGAPVRWKPAVNFNPAIDRKVDLRTTGELHAWRIQSISNIAWRISGMTIEYEMAGLR